MSRGSGVAAILVKSPVEPAAQEVFSPPLQVPEVHLLCHTLHIRMPCLPTKNYISVYQTTYVLTLSPLRYSRPHVSANKISIR